MNKRPLIALAFALLAGTSALAVGASYAQTPMPSDIDPLDDRSKKRLDRMEKVVRELRSIVFQGRDTGQPVVVQPAETGAQLQAITDRVSDLEASLQKLNAANETLSFDLDRTRKALEAQRADNDKLVARVRTLEAAAAEAAAAQQQAQAAAEEDPEVAFQRARQLMLDGDYSGAENAFQQFAELHADAPQAPEAQYWLGKTLSARGAYSEAATAYIGAIRGWPKSSWAPDATVELARSLVALKKPADACKTLDELTRRYPKPSAAVAGRAAAARAQAKCG